VKVGSESLDSPNVRHARESISRFGPGIAPCHLETLIWNRSRVGTGSAVVSVQRPEQFKQVVLEVSRSDFEKFKPTPGLQCLESFRVLHQLQFGEGSCAGIGRIRYGDTPGELAELVGVAGFVKVASLANLGDGSHLAYFEGKPAAQWAKLLAKVGVHLASPIEVTPESWRVSIEGTRAQSRKLLAELRARKIRSRIVSIGEAKVLPTSPKSLLGILTPKQREALLEAYRAGYYDIPRRVDSNRVAKSLKLGKSTAIEHRRKAEKRLLDEIVRG
jgi:HTH DNA binding domain